MEIQPNLTLSIIGSIIGISLFILGIIILLIKNKPIIMAVSTVISSIFLCNYLMFLFTIISQIHPIVNKILWVIAFILIVGMYIFITKGIISMILIFVIIVFIGFITSFVSLYFYTSSFSKIYETLFNGSWTDSLRDNSLYMCVLFGFSALFTWIFECLLITIIANIKEKNNLVYKNIFPFSLFNNRFKRK